MPVGVLVASTLPVPISFPPFVQAGLSVSRSYFVADADDPTDSPGDSEPDPNRSFNFNFNDEIIMETTDKKSTAHCSVPMLTCSSDEASPFP